MRIYQGRVQFTVVSEGQDTELSTPEAVVQYLDGAFDEDPSVEWVIAIALNRKNFPLGRFVITKGTATASLIHPREVFRPLILAGATAAIVAHNHPSGDCAPSQADILVTRQLREASKTLQIDLLDHMIIGDKGVGHNQTGYYSFAEAGLL